MILSTDNGSSYAPQPADGGFASIGTGASRALPAGGWNLPASPFAPTLPVATGRTGGGVVTPGGWETKFVPVGGVKRLPTYTDSGITTTSTGTTTETDTTRLIDLFRSMFSATTKAADPTQGAVVVYGDSTQTGTGASTGVKLLIVAAVAFAAFWAWKKWGKNAIAA